MRRLRTGSAIAEAIANVVALRWLLIVRVLLAAMIGFGVAFATVAETSGIVDRFAQEVAAGRFVWRVAPGGAAGGLPAANCDGLATVDGIRASGAVIGETAIVAANQPQARYQLSMATAGYPAVLWPGQAVSTPSGGLLAGAVVAENLGLVEGSTLLITDESNPQSSRSVRIDRVLPPSARDSGADRRLFRVVLPAGSVDECLVDADPGHSADVPGLLTERFSASAGAVVAPLRPTDSLGRRPETELDNRASGWAWLLGGGVLGVLGLMLWFFRRADLALYRLVGVPRGTLAFMLAAEQLIFTLVPVQAGFLVAVLLRRLDVRGVAADLLWLDDVRLLLVLAIVPALALLLLRGKSTVDILKGY